MPDQLAEVSVSALDRILAELDIAEIDGRPLADKAVARLQLSQLLKELGALLAELDRSIMENMTSDTEVIEGVGVLVRKQRGKRTRWEGGRILRRLLNQFQPVDTETGQVLSEPSEIAELAMERMYEVGGLHRPSHGWSTTALKKYGLSPSEFSDYEEGAMYLEVIENG